MSTLAVQLPIEFWSKLPQLLILLHHMTSTVSSESQFQNNPESQFELIVHLQSLSRPFLLIINHKVGLCTSNLSLYPVNTQNASASSLPTKLVHKYLYDAMVTSHKTWYSISPQCCTAGIAWASSSSLPPFRPPLPPRRVF